MSDPQDHKKHAVALLRLKQARLMLNSGKAQLAVAQEQIDEAQRLIDESEEVLSAMAEQRLSAEPIGETGIN